MSRNRPHLTEQELRENYADLERLVASSTSSIPNETATQKRHRLERFARNPYEAVVWYLPHYFTLPLHKEGQRLLRADTVLCPNLYVSDIWPRGFAKSTTINISVPLVRDFADLFKVGVLVGKNQEAATLLLQDIQAEYEFNERIRYDYGEQKLQGNWAEGNFRTRRGVTMLALGLDQNWRGIRRGQWRIGLAITDDCDFTELSRNPLRAKQYFNKIVEELWAARGSEPFAYFNNNNLHSEHSIQFLMREHLRGMEAMPDTKVIVSEFTCYDKHGESTWQEKYPTAFLKAQEVLQGHRFAKNYLHDTTPVGELIKEEMMPWEDPLPLGQYDAIGSYCDPAFSPTGCHTAIIYVGLKGNHYTILSVYLRQGTLPDAFDWWNDEDAEWGEKHLARNYQEKQFIEGIVRGMKDDSDRRKKRILRLRYDGRSRKGDKFLRMEAMVPLFANLHIGFSKKLRNHPDTLTLRRQLLALADGSTAAVDGPDCLEGCIWQLEHRKEGNKSGMVLMDRSEPVHY